MKLRMIWFVLMMLLPITAVAQFTQVSATVTDPNGLAYANGTVVAKLILPGGTSPTLNGLAYTPPSQPVGLNTNGFFLMQIADNNVLLPAATQWSFTVCSAAGTIQPAGGKGPVCFNAGPITITGASQSITATLNAAALALSSSSGASVNPTSGRIPFNNAGVFADSPLVSGTNTVNIATPIAGPSYSVGTGGTQAGFGDDATVWGPGVDALYVGGNRQLIAFGGELILPGAAASSGIRIASNINVNAATQATFTFETLGVWEAGQGAVGETGYIRTGGSCRVTADITLSTSPTNVCLFSNLPPLALPWSWHCDFLWSVTAGTTPTLTVGVNPSQTPTGTTNAAAELKTTNANVATENAVALSASGNTNILTTPTLTPAATIFSGSSFGTLLASGSAGTFAITMTGTGTGFAGVARAGTACQFN